MENGFEGTWWSSHSQTTGQDSPNPAIWSFGDIVPGEYAFYATWPPNRTSEAMYSFAEDGRSSVDIADQSSPPHEGVNGNWKYLGYIDVQTGLDVQIHLQGANANADGIILIPTFDPPHTTGFNCGDGERQVYIREQCDDGNKIDGDGCNSSCQVTTQCNDGVDNDSDGLTDCADSNCHTDRDAENPASCDALLNNEALDPGIHVLDDAYQSFTAQEAQQTAQNHWRSTTAKGYRSGQHSYDGPKAGGIQPQGQWRTSEVRPGTYDVYATWAPALGAKARFLISQQGRYSQRLDRNVDQGVSMYSVDSEEWDGAQWVHLGEFEVVEGEVVATIQSASLFSSGRDKFIADAIRFVHTDLRAPEPECGNGEQEEGEECDDGNSNNFDSCLNSCKEAICGDGVQWQGEEQCDDGNQINADSCTNSCESAQCGDGFKQGVNNEECDDGNQSNADSCLNTCDNATCGDEFVQEGVEGCDDGNRDDGDGCSSQCEIEIEYELCGLCGTVTCPSGQVCYEYADTRTTACANPGIVATGWVECSSGAPTAICGDGLIRGAEECDDGDLNNGDGCSGSCEVETGWVCSGEPSVCRAGCGDGVRQANEECDDGNTNDLDGCSNQCSIKHGFMCGEAANSCRSIEPLDNPDLNYEEGKLLGTVGGSGYRNSFAIHPKPEGAASSARKNAWWELPGIGQGNYDIMATWKNPYQWTYVTLSVSIQRMDGAWQSIFSKNISQQYAPNGDSLEGVKWENAGTLAIQVPIKGLKVNFSAPGDKSWTVDAVRLVPKTAGLQECVNCETRTCQQGKVCYQHRQNQNTTCANPGYDSDTWAECG